jgi:hypothetical protein
MVAVTDWLTVVGCIAAVGRLDIILVPGNGVTGPG